MKIENMSELADQVRQRCDRLAEAHRDDNAFPVKLPAEGRLRELLEETFWASLSRDEGRACRLTVSYYGGDSENASSDVAVTLEPRRFDRSILRRLAAVAFAADAEIAVCTAGETLNVFGLSKQIRPLGRESFAEALGPTLPLEIEVRGPAPLVVRYAIFRVLTYVNGEIREPGPNVLYMDGPVRSALDDLALSSGFSCLSIFVTI